MAAEWTKLSEIKADRDDWTIKVRVTWIWDGVNPSTKEIYNSNMILLDEEGNLQHALLRNNQRRTFLPQFKEGNIYMISNFKITEAKGTYRPLPKQDTVIALFHGTKVQHLKQDLKSIPQHNFALINYDELHKRANDVTYLTDVIGILSKVFDVEDFGIKPGRTRPLFKKDITLTNKRGQELKVTLWSEQALEFENILKNQTTTEIHLDLMLMPGKKNIGNIHLSSTSATEIYANLNIKEANDLRERIHNAIDQNFEIKMLPPPTKPTIEEIKLTNRLTIDQILNMKFEDGQRVSKNPDANDDTQKVQNSDTTTKRKRIKNNSEAGDNATQPNDDTSQLEDTEDEECEHVPIVKQQAKVPERRESRRARKKKIIMDD
ncbi:hypothetical protein RJ639_022355 [Escallonia herrerae]|uniref:Uncharacterized protein n=1 Tax=Escallonia herrerae TaxID=1293975 RepID=A0AA88V2G5_9ASTE|nr:hypothetical protein RJ639_022355 [Escallonia herrerae]